MNREAVGCRRAWSARAAALDIRVQRRHAPPLELAGRGRRHDHAAQRLRERVVQAPTKALTRAYYGLLGMTRAY